MLAVCGRDARSGQPFIHVKSWKQNRLYTEVIVTEGTVRIHCRECLRWHTVRILHTSLDVQEERLPDGIKIN